MTIGQPAGSAGAGGGGRAHPVVPGGFAKLFNRVIDSGAWAALPEAARAVYVPLVRFADPAEGFRVRAGVATLMRCTQLSRSSVKRGLRALHEGNLITLLRPGGVGPDGVNRANVYQLLVPEPSEGEASSKAKTLSSARAKRGGRRAVASDLPGGSYPDPPAVHGGAPTGIASEPPPGPAANPGEEPVANPGGGSRDDGAGVTGDPLLRQSQRNQAAEADAAVEEVDVGMFAGDGLDRPAAPAMVELLRGWGVDPTAAQDLAATHAPGQVLAAVALARQAKARGRLRNPAGFIVRCLEEEWAPGVGAVGGALEDPAARQAREQAARRQEEARAAEARAAADARIDELDDETLRLLVGRVLEAHAGRPAMLRLLSARPPRESRLMRAEVAALIGEA